MRSYCADRASHPTPCVHSNDESQRQVVEPATSRDQWSSMLATSQFSTAIHPGHFGRAAQTDGAAQLCSNESRRILGGVGKIVSHCTIERRSAKRNAKGCRCDPLPRTAREVDSLAFHLVGNAVAILDISRNRLYRCPERHSFASIAPRHQVVLNLAPTLP